MIESVIANIGWIALGIPIGMVIMLFIARKNPKWIEDVYQKQRALSMQGTEEVEKLKAQVKELELDKLIEGKVSGLKAELEALKAKIKG
jgi:CRISPR/Cas system-associated exonuclease Cas4 (RecB family)